MNEHEQIFFVRLVKRTNMNKGFVRSFMFVNVRSFTFVNVRSFTFVYVYKITDIPLYMCILSY